MRATSRRRTQRLPRRRTPREPGEPAGDDPQTPPPASATVRLVPSAPSFRVGDRVTVEVRIENATNVGSVPYHLRYNRTAVLEYVPPANQGPFLNSDGTNTVFLANDAPGGGEIIVGLSRLGGGDGMSGSGTLGVVPVSGHSPGRLRLRLGRRIGQGSAGAQRSGQLPDGPRGGGALMSRIRTPRSQRGLTLIELVCCSAIILVLAGAAVPVANTWVKRRKELELRQALREIRIAIDKFQWDAEHIQSMGLEAERGQRRALPREDRVALRGLRRRRHRRRRRSSTCDACRSIRSPARPTGSRGRRGTSRARSPPTA